MTSYTRLVKCSHSLDNRHVLSNSTICVVFYSPLQSLLSSVVCLDIYSTNLYQMMWYGCETCSIQGYVMYYNKSLVWCKEGVVRCILQTSVTCFTTIICYALQQVTSVGKKGVVVRDVHYKPLLHVVASLQQYAIHYNKTLVWVITCKICILQTSVTCFNTIICYVLQTSVTCFTTIICYVLQQVTSVGKKGVVVVRDVYYKPLLHVVASLQQYVIHYNSSLVW